MPTISGGRAEARRRAMSITARQLFLGMMAAGFTTAEEAVAAATTGAIPSALESVIGQMPAGDAAAVRITWASMTQVERMHPLVDIIRDTMNMTDEQVDDFFALSATL